MKSKVDWPGWPLSDNPYGTEFDAYARKVMVAESKMLLPLLKRYQKEMGEDILEIGPFFTPLVTEKTFPKKNLAYWDNDAHALEHLSGKNKHQIDLDSIPARLKKIQFDTIVASQIFNYIDYRKFLMDAKLFLRKGGLIFINNVVSYGLPTLFSDRRPKNIAETISSLRQAGFEIVEKQASRCSRDMRKKRLLLVARLVK